MYEEVVKLHQERPFLQEQNNSLAFQIRFDLKDQKFCIFDGENFKEELTKFDDKNKFLDPNSQEIKDMSATERNKIEFKKQHLTYTHW